MKWINRIIYEKLLNSVETRPVVLLTGIRQSGKSALLQKLFPRARYVTFDNYLNIESAGSNPVQFLSGLGPGQIILDEIQYVPGLFRELKILVDKDRHLPAKWILTGSQKFSLLEQAGESLAGRITILELETLGAEELMPFFPQKKIEEILWKGGFPETWAVDRIEVSQYMDDYVSTYLEKDLRNLIQVSSLRDFHRFLRALALRCGSLVNFSDLARDTGISPNTAKAWLNTLEQTGIVSLLEPWFRNLSKRLAKTPKLYFNDQGLLCRLLNISSQRQIFDHALAGSIWENFVFNELLRCPGISVKRNLFFYRDQNQVEVDFMMEEGGSLILIEAKFKERPGKTAIPRVIKVLGEEYVRPYCACLVPEKGIFPGKEYSMINPLLTGVSTLFSGE